MTLPVRLLGALVLLIGCSMSAAAQDEQPPRLAAGECFLSMKGGSGVTAFKACLSRSGNLTRFATGGVEHLDVGDVAEGWRVCQWTRGDENGNPGFQQVAQDLDAGRDDDCCTDVLQPNGPNTFPFTTLGQIGDTLRLTQFFSRNTAAGTVTIKMRLTNLTGRTSPEITIQRWVDIDADGTPDDDLLVTGHNFALFTSSVGTGRGVMLTGDTASYPRGAAVARWNDTENFDEFNCGPDESAGAQPADQVGLVSYSLGKIKAGSSKTVSFTYRAF